MASPLGRPIEFETRPDRYQHWKLTFDGPVATLSMDVQEGGGLSTDYRLKLNSYDLAVDIELADAIQRIRFEHPEVRTVVLQSAKERIFCAGANIFMLAGADHGLKVNFCKFTNETRLAMEDASQHSGIKFIAAVNGTCAGGGYELALACDEILLVDDGHAAVSLPETPLLAVLPGTGGLTRLVDKRKVRRDLADFFCTLTEGIKGKRAVEWRLVDAVHSTSRFKDAVDRRARELAVVSDRPEGVTGITLGPLEPRVTDAEIAYGFVTLTLNREQRTAELHVSGPDGPQPQTPDEMCAQGDRFWALRAFRELDDAICRVRLNEPEIGTVLIRTVGDPERIVSLDRVLAEHRQHWLVREVIHLVKRTLKRIDLTARTFFAIVEPGNAFAGTLFELALAADRAYMLDCSLAGPPAPRSPERAGTPETPARPSRPNTIALSPMNAGLLPMSNGLSRLDVRFLGEPERAGAVLDHDGPFDTRAALEAGLVTFAPDDLDWDDEVRLAVEGRVSLSPDALTGMEASLRFPGPETLETKIFGRLSAWQNWIFQRPNAVGERGALKAYGASRGRPAFDWRRT